MLFIAFGYIWMIDGGISCRTRFLFRCFALHSSATSSRGVDGRFWAPGRNWTSRPAILSVERCLVLSTRNHQHTEGIVHTSRV